MVLTGFICDFLTPTSSIPADMSKPIFSAFVSAINIAKSPVPVAMSKIVLGFAASTILALFLHLISMPKEITRFKLSYFQKCYQTFEQLALFFLVLSLYMG
jgi:hypothetical protein